MCEQKGIEIIEAQACSDHIHMLLGIPLKYSISQIMEFFKGKSSLMIFDFCLFAAGGGICYFIKNIVYYIG